MTPPTDADRRPLGALLIALFISVFGTAMSEIAVPWLVLTRTGSAVTTGAVAFAEMAPYVCLQALAGPLVDRLGARRSCVVGNAAAAILVCSVPALYAAGGLGIAPLMLLMAGAGAARGMADCANNVLLPVTAAQGGVSLERAAGLSATANRAGLLIGAPAAGVLVAVLDAPTVVLADGLTFAVATALIAALVPASGRSAGTNEQLTVRTYGRQLAEGLRFVRGQRLLLGIVTMIAVTNLLDQGLAAVLLPVWVRSHHHGAAALGLIAGVAAVGALVGSMIGAWLGPRLPRRAGYALGFLLCSPRYLVLALAGTLPPVLVVVAIAGLASGCINPIIGAVSYERIPPEFQARVLGTIKASAWIGIPIGSLLAGSLATITGLSTTLLLAGGIYFATTLAPFLFPVWRELGRPRAGVTPSPSIEVNTAPAD